MINKSSVTDLMQLHKGINHYLWLQNLKMNHMSLMVVQPRRQLPKHLTEREQRPQQEIHGREWPWKLSESGEIETIVWNGRPTIVTLTAHAQIKLMHCGLKAFITPVSNPIWIQTCHIQQIYPGDYYSSYTTETETFKIICTIGVSEVITSNSTIFWQV